MTLLGKEHNWRKDQNRRVALRLKNQRKRVKAANAVQRRWRGHELHTDPNGKWNTRVRKL